MKFAARLMSLLIIVLAGIGIVPALAATTTLVVTESQINPLISGLTYTYGSYTVTNPSVDFRMTPGVVRINATITQNGVAKQGRVVLAPVLSGGKVSWTLVSATINGKPGTPAQIAFLTTTLTGLWTKVTAPFYSSVTVNSLLITETKITTSISY